MFYEQKTRYLQYRYKGEKISGGGFVKWENCGDRRSFVLQVNGLPAQYSGEREVLLQEESGARNIGLVMLENGRGRLELQGGLNWEHPEHLRILLDKDQELFCDLREETRRKQEAEAAGAQSELAEREPQSVQPQRGQDLQAQQEPKALEAGMQRSQWERESRQRPEVQVAGEKWELPERDPQTVQPQGEQDLLVQQPEMQAAGAPEVQEEKRKDSPENDRAGLRTSSGERYSVGHQKKERQGDRPVPRMNLRAGKWEQLAAIYPRITPFGDSRSYLQISPGDFVILKEKSYQRANNSFLLHGFFTYQHLILHRRKYKGEQLYYVGVPGKFYEKEKEVALLFGFESFESETEPASEGDFGYYMMRVEL